jgi:hypothetical protein
LLFPELNAQQTSVASLYSRIGCCKTRINHFKLDMISFHYNEQLCFSSLAHNKHPSHYGSALQPTVPPRDVQHKIIIIRERFSQKKERKLLIFAKIVENQTPLGHYYKSIIQGVVICDFFCVIISASYFLHAVLSHFDTCLLSN